MFTVTLKDSIDMCMLTMRQSGKPLSKIMTSTVSRGKIVTANISDDVPTDLIIKEFIINCWSSGFFGYCSLELVP